MKPMNLHQLVGSVVTEFHNPPEITVHLDAACGTPQQNRLYLNAPRRSTCMCCVDIQIDYQGRPEVMIEIEDRGNNGPFKLMGKFAEIMIAQCYKGKGRHAPVVPLHDLTFVQILSADSLKATAFKRAQYRMLEERVRSFLPLGAIGSYCVIVGGVADFAPGKAGCNRLCEVLRSTRLNMGYIDLD